MLTRIRSGCSRSYQLALGVADDWWQLAACWSAVGALAVNGIVLPLYNHTATSLAELAATIGSVATLVGVHAWRSVKREQTAAVVSGQTQNG